MRTLSAAYWSAKNAASPARKTAEVGNIGLGSKAQAVETLMMAPPFAAPWWAQPNGSAGSHSSVSVQTGVHAHRDLQDLLA
jgi:hypothetical protein